MRLNSSFLSTNLIKRTFSEYSYKVTMSLDKQYNAELKEAADQEKISSAVDEQVALVGSRVLYERINSNFREGKFEAFFAKVKVYI